MCAQRIITAKRESTVIYVLLDERCALNTGGDFVLGEHGWVQRLGNIRDANPQFDPNTPCNGPLRIEFTVDSVADTICGPLFVPKLFCRKCQLQSDLAHFRMGQQDIADWSRELKRCLYASAVPAARSNPILGVSLIQGKQEQGFQELHPCFNTRLRRFADSDAEISLVFLAKPEVYQLALDVSFDIIFTLAEASRTHEHTIKRALGF